MLVHIQLASWEVAKRKHTWNKSKLRLAISTSDMHCIDLYWSILPPYCARTLLWRLWVTFLFESLISKHISWAQSTKQGQNPMIFHTLFPKVIIPPPVVLNMYGRPLHQKSTLKFGASFWRVSSWQPGIFPKTTLQGTLTYPHISPLSTQKCLEQQTCDRYDRRVRVRPLKGRQCWNNWTRMFPIHPPPPKKRNKHHPPKNHKSTKPKHATSGYFSTAYMDG